MTGAYDYIKSTKMKGGSKCIMYSGLDEVDSDVLFQNCKKLGSKLR